VGQAAVNSPPTWSEKPFAIVFCTSTELIALDEQAASESPEIEIAPATLTTVGIRTLTPVLLRAGPGAAPPAYVRYVPFRDGRAAFRRSRPPPSTPAR
jgi:hypothetical protein